MGAPLQDADLWRWALPESKAFHAGFCSLRLNWDANANPGIWSQLLQLSPSDVIQKACDPQNTRRLAVSALSNHTAQMAGWVCDSLALPGYHYWHAV